MKLSSVLGNRQKLDGGAMFGNAPKALWTRWVPVDDRNRIDLACRAMLAETGKERVLFESGIGCYMAPKWKDRYGVQEDEHVLLSSLAALGLGHEDINAVVLSHLHFDHAGGLLSAWREGESPRLLFPNARFYVGRAAWERACDPHPRDRASFVPELNAQLAASGRLEVLDADAVLGFGDLTVRFFQSDGHTPGMMCADLRCDGTRVVFAADLIPGRPWVHLPITMGYDRFPERLIDEKRRLLEGLAADGGWLYYTHDHEVAASKVAYDPENDRFSPMETRPALTREALG